MKKRILMMLVIVVLTCLLPTVALAEDTHTKHPICGSSCSSNHDDAPHRDVEWTEIVKGTNLTQHDAYDYCYKLDTDKTHYYLSGNVSLPTPAGSNINYPLKITQDTYLCLGGYSLSGGVVVDEGATLYLCDCKGGGTISKSGGRGVTVNSGGTFVMYSGSVANCSSPHRENGAGVYVGSGGRFDMYGGTIESCSTYNDIIYPSCGGGVYVTGTGVFNMNDGLIDSCKANKGGGVAAGNGGTFNMNGGTIQDCSINSYHNNKGGGVYITENGNFTMNDGSITNCSAFMGGGVYADSTTGSFTLAGGSITGCASSEHTYYGAVYLNGANMTVSGEVTIQGTGDGDLTIYKGHNTNGVITFTGNGKLAENICIYIVPAWGNKWSTKEDTRFISAASDTQRDTLKSQITLYVDNGDVKTGKIYTYGETDLRFAESNRIYVNRNNSSWGTVTLTQGSASPVTSGDCFETITVTAQPAAGYDLISLTATMNYGSAEITLDPESENVFTFKMPADSVAVTATFGIIREHALCQADNCNLDHAGHDILSLLPVSTEAELEAAAESGGSYYLANDVEISGTINVAEGKTLSLCLNGYSIRPDSGGSYGRAFQVERTGTFNLTDCKDSGAITGFTTSEEGGGVYNSGIFTMYNGTISNNKTYVYGGGVFNQGDAYIYGGTIENNTADVNGGGLYHYHSADGLLLSGSPTISGNTVNDVDNNVYLDIALTIDENFAPATDIGITTAEFGRFAEAADGADIENIAVYEQYFASEGDFPIYTQGNALCIGYYITEDPNTANNYTVGVNSTNVVSYQWYKVDIQEAVVTDSNCADPEEWRENYANYNAATGWTAVDDEYNYEKICYFKVNMTPDDVLTVNCSGPVTGELKVMDLGGDSWYPMTLEGDAYTFTATESEVHLLYYQPAPDEDADDAPTVQATLTRVDKEAVDGQTEAALKTGGLGSGTYACKVTWNMGTSDDYTIDSETVEYVKASPSSRPASRPASNPSYPVVESKDEDSDGTVSFSKSRATRGSTVTVTVTPDKYYGVGKVIVRDASGKEIETIKNADGTYSFKMPYGKVTVEAVYVWENPFVDVAEDTFYIDAVEWTLKNSITEGTSATTFSPVASCTRAQMVTFLWRAAGCPEPSGAICAFTDVDMDSYYGKAVLWALEKGITKGTSDTTFSPDMECSRAQMATFLCRMADGKAESDENAFVDVRADAYYADSVQWAVENGITEGTGEGKFSPDAPCTRGQMVTFLYRYYVK